MSALRSTIWLRIYFELTRFGGSAPVIASDTGMHGSPTRTDKGGIEVTCNLLPAITAGRPFVVRSRFASGSYRATKVQHKINSWGMTWETRLEGVPWQ